MGISPQLIAKTLFQALENLPPEVQAADANLVYLRAQWTPALADFRNHTGFYLEQSYAPDCLSLREHGYKAVPELADTAAARLVLYVATRSQEENLAELARGWQMLEEGGWLVVCQHNDLGAKRFDAQLRKLAGNAQVQSYSKHHCRAVMAQKTVHENPAELARWAGVMQEITVPGTPLKSHPGLFSWKKVDEGSAFLASHLPQHLKGHGVDVCAGWGYLSRALLQRMEPASELLLIEAEKRALDMAEKNITSLFPERACHYLWADAARSWPDRWRGLDWAVMNPPAHDLYVESPAMVTGIFRATAEALRQGGKCWVVANSHLPYERTLEDIFTNLTTVADNGRFKILEMVR